VIVNPDEDGTQEKIESTPGVPETPPPPPPPPDKKEVKKTKI
jgi:hypothetical protein